jgi:hypothetical protein
LPDPRQNFQLQSPERPVRFEQRQLRQFDYRPKTFSVIPKVYHSRHSHPTFFVANLSYFFDHIDDCGGHSAARSYKMAHGIECLDIHSHCQKKFDGDFYSTER